jgi:hypothetical protein
MNHSMRHDLIKDGGYHPAVDDVLPSLKLSLNGKPAHSLSPAIGNFHAKAYGIERTTGKTVCVVRKPIL